ncbi:T9SS type A sorting domain-containing protein [Pontibacter sp. SGAir0037]|uniref:T9SS type A sorting domain-containing protein n=1 Tax=Pontibacter sp. SGAir0037 TaxID=2571030 RepID=UPI0010CD55A0|nr:T9SS type A sorting domain-containing protein [Pontibacter sp. SGAir0037]QCR23747.1 hypothetical protein C1N53_16270 [Pontibacter sp. SGAir0037]
MKHLFTLLFWFCTASLSVAQNSLQFRQRLDIPLTLAASNIPMPWSGGLSTPQFSAIDLNKDGREDLFVFDRMQGKVFTYLAVQQQGEWRYQYAPEYEALFPGDLEYWVLLRDYNCDGLKDIFTNGLGGIRAYKQTIGENGQIAFVLDNPELTYAGSTGREINMLMLSDDIPAIVDMDGDGDLDVLITEFSRGTVLEYYRNVQVEEGLSCGTLKFVKESEQWGGIYECENQNCNNFMFHVECRVAAPLHSGHDGSSLLTIDLNGNGVKDLLIGSVECDNLVMMENKGSKTVAYMDSFEPLFPLNTSPAQLNLFPAAYYEDVTFDGIPDLIVASNSSNNTENKVELQRSVLLYKNNRTADHPDFVYEQNNFLQKEMLDLGDGAYPAFADLDGDGKLDMLIGNRSSYRNGGYTGSLAYLRNVGTASEPAFTLISDNYLGLAGQGFVDIKPAFADINGNGAADLVLTVSDKQTGATQIIYISNTGEPGQEWQLDWANRWPLLAVTPGDSPCFADVDGDGDLDMLIGKTLGFLEFHRNTGSISNPVFVKERDDLGGISYNVFRYSLYPAIADLNGNGTPDLVTVDNSGAIRVYTDFTKDLNALFEAQTNLLENNLTKQVQPTKLGKNLGIAIGALGDEGKLFAAIGTQGGGLYLLEQTAGGDNNPGAAEEAFHLLVYPNPADVTRAEETFRVQATVDVAVEVYDAVGKKVYSSGSRLQKVHSLKLPQVRSGVYFLRATSQEGKHQVRKVVLN